MEAFDHPLLRPSLSGADVRRTPFSLQAQLAAAFFGGPVAALGFFAINIVRLRRGRTDAPAAALAVAGIVALEVALHFGMPGSGISLVEVARRALALAIFALAASRHRREQAACDLMGQQRPNGVLPAIGLIVVGNTILSLTAGAWR